MRRPQKTCSICESGVRVVDFKDERTLSRFLSERGQDPAEPTLGHLRPAPASAQHRHQAGPGAGAPAVPEGPRRLSVAQGRPPEGQVLSLRARLAVVGYVAFTWPIMTAFLFGPLALLIAGSRPQGRRAWFWLAALTLWLAFWAAQPGSLLEELIRAAAVLSAGDRRPDPAAHAGLGVGAGVAGHGAASCWGPRSWRRWWASGGATSNWPWRSKGRPPSASRWSC